MQFDVFRLSALRSDGGALLVDVQANLLADFPTRVVIPLILPEAFGRRSSRLNPVLTFLDVDYVLATNLLAAIERRRLIEVLGSVAHHRHTIVAAIDVLLGGV